MNPSNASQIKSWDPRLYDALLEIRNYPSWELDVYLALSQLLGGPVLELGTGTARVLGALLQAGVDAYGLELNSGMASAGRDRLIAMGRTDSNERLLVDDMTQFSNSRRYKLVFLAYNTLAQVHDPESLSSLLERVSLVLAPGGELAFDIFLPHQDELVRSGEAALTIDGLPVTFRERLEYVPETRMQTIDQTFEFSDGSTRQLRVRNYVWPIPELEGCVRRHGYEFVGRAIDEQGRPISSTSSLYIARLRRAHP